MTNLALAEKIRKILVAQADHVDTEQHNQRVIHRVTIRKQVFIVTCEESVPDKWEPAV
jgi:hypothetical protein